MNEVVPHCSDFEELQFLQFAVLQGANFVVSPTAVLYIIRAET